VDLNHVVAELDKMLRRVIGEDVELNAVLEPDLDSVQADVNQLEQVIMNLAVNARDAMPEGGKLTISTTNIMLDSLFGHGLTNLPRGAYVRLSVRDTGCGMDKETQGRLFEPFFTTKGPGKGTGLGLATVYGIIHQLNGQIVVSSEPGRGSTFDIYLPVGQSTGMPKSASGPSVVHDNARKADAPPAAALLPTAELPHLGSETILLTEDEDMLRNLVKIILRQHGYQVLEARNGNEAIQRAADHEGSIHLLVTDVVMPGVNGRQLAERLRSLRPEMKVLYISGYTDDAIVRHGIHEPTMAFLSKPFTPMALVDKVRNVLGAAPGE
jgi:CheY-like chemotaxis protein